MIVISVLYRNRGLVRGHLTSSNASCLAAELQSRQHISTVINHIGDETRGIEKARDGGEVPLLACKVSYSDFSPPDVP